MSAPCECPDLEVLFTELAEGEGPALAHARECARCSAVMAEHRQLERELYRMVDPLPPPELVRGVMARVASEPVPLRRELWTGLTILGLSLAAGLGLFLSSDAAVARAGLALASLLVQGRDFVNGLATGAEALWATAAAPLVFLVVTSLLASLYALRRLVGEAPSLSEA